MWEEESWISLLSLDDLRHAAAAVRCVNLTLKGRGHFESLLYNFNILMGKSMKNHVVEKFERKKSFKIRYFKNNDKNCVWLKPNYYSNPIFQIHF